MKSIIPVLLLCLLMITSGVAGDKKITKNKIPSAVLDAFQKSYPNATIKGQAVETEKGVKYYEIESVDRTQHRDLLYTIDGKVYECEEAMDPATMPTNVKATIEKEFPKGKITKVEKTTQGDAVTYDIRVKVGKKTKSVTVDSTGKIVK